MVRVKRRYIVLKIKQQKGIRSHEDFVRELRNKVEQLYGDFGIACLNRGFSVKKYDKNEGFMILSLRKGVHEMVLSAAPLVTNVNQSPCSVTILHLSGTIRGCLKQLKQDYIMNIRASIAKTLSKQKPSTPQAVVDSD